MSDDPYSANVVLLLHLEGANNTTAFPDVSPLPKTVTVTGNTKISTAQSKWENGSGYFDGSGDRLTVATSLDFSLGATFTIEVWMYPTTTPSVGNSCRFLMFGVNNTSTGLDVAFNNDLSFFIGRPLGTGSYLRSSANIVTLNAWHHYAIACNNGTAMMFKDGVVVAGPSALSTQDTGSVPLYIGYDTVGTVDFQYQGYLQDLRITQGVARYTADFTPPDRLPDPDPMAGRLFPAPLCAEVYDGGLYRITGTVDELGVAGAYRVRLFDRVSGRCLRETWSAADGTYAFQNIAYRYRGYFVIAYDHGDNPHNAAIADLMTPEAMP